jgi:hypothetical protein
MKPFRYLIISFLLISGIAHAQKLENVTANGPLLSKSSPLSDTIRMIPKDSVVKILSEPTAEGFCYVAYEGDKGYVQKNLLSVTVLPIDIKKYKLNQFDDKGKKDSLWIQYLDGHWKILKDSTNAMYYR